jgi:hypothetical protein
MIYVGIDDTDTVDTPGTNQLARALVARVAEDYQCVLIARHQLLLDPRISSSITPADWVALGTRAGGEVVMLPD